MTTPADLIDRANFIEGGLRRRAREHAWSYERWSKRRSVTLWATLFAGAATASSVVTALSQNADIAWLVTALAAVSAGIGGYEKYADPSGTAEKHAFAQRQLEMLRDDYGEFVSVRAKRLSPDHAERRILELEAERRRLLAEIISVEPDAHHALEAEKRLQRGAARPSERH